MTTAQPDVGTLLRGWRERQRVTQLQLALDAGISARHLSFVETGRSKPGRELMLKVLEQLAVPFRERNRLVALTAMADVDPALLEPPINVMRLGLHPRGLAPLFTNFADLHAHWMRRLTRQLAATGDEQLAALIDEVAGYGEPDDGALDVAGGDMLGPIRMRTPGGGELVFFGMFATFDTPFEVTTSELAIEVLFPADRTTAETLRQRGTQ